VLDAGDAYASNISVDEKGRTILWLWGRTNLPAERSWNSLMVLPRILSVGADGFLRQQPAPEFESLRGEEQIHGMGPGALEGLRGDVLEVMPSLARPTPIGFECGVPRQKAGGNGGDRAWN
jgi:beta-fructofuranosidase